MICDRCGNENFEIVWVKRNRLWSDAKKAWVHSDDCDARKILCTECQQVFMTNTQKVHAIVYNEGRQKPSYVNPKEIRP